MALAIQFIILQKGTSDAITLDDYFFRFLGACSHLLRVAGFYYILSYRKIGNWLVFAGLTLDIIFSWPLFLNNFTVKWLIFDFSLLVFVSFHSKDK